MVFVIEPRRLAALSISFFGKNHFGKRNNGIMLKLFLYLILCLWVVSVKTGNIVVLIYDKLFKRALHKFKLWMVYLWKLKPVLSPHLWRWQHAASDKVQSVRMSKRPPQKGAKLFIWNEFPQSDGRLINLLGWGGSVWDCNCHIGGWAEAEPGNVKTYLLGTILVETLYERVTLTLSIPVSYIMHSVLNG